MEFPRVAGPTLWARCCFRCFTRDGINMSDCSHALRLRLRSAHGSIAAALPLRKDVALVDPYLDADHAVGRHRLSLTEVDIRAQRVQGNATSTLLLAARHLTAAEPAGHGNSRPFGAALHGPLDGLLHGPPEGHPLLQLVGNISGHERGVELRRAHLLDVDAYLLARLPLQRLTKLFDVGSAAADDDAGPGRVNGGCDLVGRAFDIDLRDTRVLMPPQNQLAHLHVLVQQLGIVLLVEPLGLPGLDDAKPETDGVDFLSH